MKVGLIRCMQTEALCPAFKCLAALRNWQGAFAGIDEEITLVGVNTCGGCPGKNAVLRAANLVQIGAEAIALASCVGRNAPVPIGMECPHFAAMKAAIKKRVGPEIRVFEYTHD